MAYQTRFGSDKTAELLPDAGGLLLRSSYDAALVDELKSRIPYTERKWDNDRKAWIVAPQHGPLVAGLCAQYLGVAVSVPVLGQTAAPEIRILDIRYIGGTKARQGYEERTATGFCNGDWSVIVPESALLQWFTGVVSRVEATTLYGVLGIGRGVTQEEIKTAFRRMARQWHPDVCREPDAHATFIKIKNAYDLLADPGKRARYDAGLALEATLQPMDRQTALSWAVDPGFRPPLRCGYVQAEGVAQVGRFVVAKIYGWEDITDARGRTLVTSWPMGASTHTEDWI